MRKFIYRFTSRIRYPSIGEETLFTIFHGDVESLIWSQYNFEKIKRDNGKHCDSFSFSHNRGLSPQA